MAPLDAHQTAAQILAAARSSSNPSDTLLLPRTATFQEAREAYKRLLFLHPDKLPGNELAAEAFKCLNAAYNKIKSKQELVVRSSHPLESRRKWKIFTGDDTEKSEARVEARPGEASHPPRQEVASLKEPSAASRWRRPSIDTQGLLKVPASSHRIAQVTKPIASRPAGEGSPGAAPLPEDICTLPRLELDTSQTKSQGRISNEEFYYNTLGTKRGHLLSGKRSADSGSAANASKWATRTVLRTGPTNSLAAGAPLAKTAHRPMRNEEEEEEEETLGEKNGSSESESEMEVDPQEAILDNRSRPPRRSNDGGKGKGKASAARGRSKRSTEFLKVLVAQEAATKISVSHRAAAAASKQRRAAAVQSAFFYKRRGGKSKATTV